MYSVNTQSTKCGARNAFLSSSLHFHTVANLCGYGFKETWTARSDWKYDHNLLWIFVVLIVSVCVLLFNLVSMYFL